jgi:DNA-binding CsgD family transcriptional regulator
MEQDKVFSEREQQVIACLIQGRSNKQIALALGISIRGVEFHLSNIYARLGVSSRTEAALKLSGKELRESTDENEKDALRESAVVGTGENADNGGKPVSTRRLSMKNMLFAGAILLATTLVIVSVLANLPVKSAQTLPPAAIVIKTITPTPTETLTPQPTISPKVHILEQIRQAVAEYEQNVQAEKKTGKVEVSKDPKTGEEIFLFKDESLGRIWDLNEKLWEKVNQLDQLYVQVYRDELKPTPFPTQSTDEQNKAYYASISGEIVADTYCSVTLWQQDPNAVTLQAYAPDEGKNRTFYIGDIPAHCEVYGQMLEEFRTTPLLAKLDQVADKALIRQVINQPDLNLTFQSISGLANAAGRSAALYIDETGTKYYVDIETAQLAAIEPNYPSHPDIPPAEAKSMTELRGVAKQFALLNSPRLAGLEKALLYEEGCKVNICFFRWDYRNKDWSGTDWAMMPPLIQIGLLTNGQLATYINTLDLFK